MKHRQVTIALICSTLISVCGAKEKTLSVAVVDLDRVIQQSDYARNLGKDIDKKVKSRRESLLKAQTELRKQGGELEKMKLVESKKKVEAAEKEFTEKRVELEKKSQAFYAELQEEQAQASKKFTNVVDGHLKKQKEYDLVLQKGAVVYFDDRKIKDITDHLIKSLPKK